jgi:putative phosphoribosyl transferase
MIYKDRTQAGQILAEMLREYKGKPCVVLSLPNGGIPVGLEIARELEFEFDLLFVSKITPKFNTEIGYGSVSESGVINFNEELLKRLSLTVDEVEDDIKKTRRKVVQRMKKYKLKYKKPDIKDKTAILVDDGIASGYTMINARDTVKKRGAKEIVIAIPTAPLANYNILGDMADMIICPDVRDAYRFAVADAYDNWYDISDEGAIKFLKKYDYM